MARTPTSPVVRLRKLEAALEKAKAFKRDATISFEPMMELLGVSRPTLRDWCNDLPGFAESGAFVGGGNGIEYAFKPAATVRFLIKHFKAEAEARVAKARAVRQMVGGDRLEGVPDDFDLDQIDKMIRVSSRLREERQAAGELVDAGKVSDALRTMMTTMQQAGVKAASQQDPTGQWPPEIRESFEDAVNNVLVAMGRAGEKALSALRGRTA